MELGWIILCRPETFSLFGYTEDEDGPVVSLDGELAWLNFKARAIGIVTADVQLAVTCSSDSYPMLSKSPGQTRMIKKNGRYWVSLRGKYAH